MQSACNALHGVRMLLQQQQGSLRESACCCSSVSLSPQQGRLQLAWRGKDEFSAAPGHEKEGVTPPRRPAARPAVAPGLGTPGSGGAKVQRAGRTLVSSSTVKTLSHAWGMAACVCAVNRCVTRQGSALSRTTVHQARARITQRRARSASLLILPAWRGRWPAPSTQEAHTHTTCAAWCPLPWRPWTARTARTYRATVTAPRRPTVRSRRRPPPPCEQGAAHAGAPEHTRVCWDLHLFGHLGGARAQLPGASDIVCASCTPGNGSRPPHQAEQPRRAQQSAHLVQPMVRRSAALSPSGMGTGREGAPPNPPRHPPPTAHYSAHLVRPSATASGMGSGWQGAAQSGSKKKGRDTR